MERGRRSAARRPVELPSRGLGVGEVLQGAAGALSKDETVVGGVARRHFEAAASASGQARPQARLSIRQVPEDGSGSASSGGGRVDEAFWTAQRREHRRPERVHGEGPATGKYADLSENLDRNLGKKGKPVMEDGTVRRFAPTAEVSIEAALTRRRKIHPADKLTQRNGIGLAKPGDKAVARAEYEPGYFKGGGVIVGSTSGLHRAYPKRRSVRRPASSDPAETAASLRGYGQPPAPPAAPARYQDMTLEQRRQAEALVESIRAIESLNPADDSSDDSDGGVPVPSRGVAASSNTHAQTWEEATGCFTVESLPARPEPAVPLA